MEKRHLDLLMRKFLSGTTTDFERKQLDDWYKQKNSGEVVWEEEIINEAQIVEDEMRTNLISHMHKQRKPVKRLGTWWTSAAAVILISFVIFIIIIQRDLTHKSNKTVAVTTPGNNLENRYLFLPDSSRVVLHPGSKFNYKFNGTIREVFLEGEAYFDVKHKKEPFVIHTGKIITTVLGTAFNVKAYRDQPVLVTVTRGKVSVADDNKKVIFLSPDQQATYSREAKSLVQQNIVSDKVVVWMRADMDFDGLKFGKLAEKLERRYGYNINFKNEKMRNCQISGRFKGTESIDEVFKIISATLSSNYVIKGNSITVDGKGCNQ